MSNNTKQTTKSNNTNLTADTVIKSLEKIQATQTKWAERYDKVNKSLYSILAKCQTEVEKLRNAKAEVAKEFNQHLVDNYGVSRPDAMRLESKVIRFVFGNIGEGRSTAYSSVLTKAKNAKVKPKDLAGWIEGLGGIEEIRRGDEFGQPKEGGNSSQSRQTKVDAAVAALDDLPALDIDSLSKNEGLEYCVVVMRQAADGTATPVAEVTSLSMVKNVLAGLTHLQAEKSQDDENKHNADNATQQNELIKLLIASGVTAEQFDELKKAA